MFSTVTVFQFNHYHAFRSRIFFNIDHKSIFKFNNGLFSAASGFWLHSLMSSSDVPIYILLQLVTSAVQHPVDGTNPVQQQTFSKFLRISVVIWSTLYVA